jgi:hypothetical protein
MECGIVVKHDCAVWQNEAGEVVNSEKEAYGCQSHCNIDYFKCIEHK